MELIEKVKKLISLMNENGLAEMEVEEEATKIRLKRNSMDSIQTSIQLPDVKSSLQEGATKYLTSQDESNTSEVVAPMVGTFYTSAPGAGPYVDIGDEVGEETVVCIVEAMKIMNEVKAETKGKIVEILVENGTAVEYGQPLFSVEPSGEEN
ncbi:acetyl-CoA carboxylase biotin carboxyl carrier protein [Candidatus Scalindua japonica]|uniref:Biotin carboxyl carrier protein of acetyl-CoA carboxylase n=1 Tax=Candidatus Scalindua japonica TaxID=1284222 RepID=A0A286U428_9BACT|nr:acetyl-CoA carboxylase biotin carboxyl carrier protein [Candidatus Scalindua japonica]GAX62874.1 acetyl-CoA carboxylase biotin carboxyl carrier protein [Candidatus Scalindua japonica]